jgi:hypothetical protein
MATTKKSGWTYEIAAPGHSPLIHQQAYVYDGEGFTVATTTEENALLMVNAPDLLAVAREMLSTLDNPYREGDRCVRDRAREVLRKIAGRDCHGF